MSSSVSAAPSSLMRSRRIKAGSESPWTTSVTKITANVRNWISSRSGNGALLLVVKGNDRAAASDTAPRMPIQPSRNRLRAGTRRSRWLDLRSSMRNRYGTVKNQIIRVSTVTPAIASPQPSSVAIE